MSARLGRQWPAGGWPRTDTATRLRVSRTKEESGQPALRHLGRAPWRIIFVIAGLALAGMLTANPVETAAALLVLALLVALTWRRGEVPILTFAVGFQWLQVTAKVLHADSLGVPLGGLTPLGGTDRFAGAPALSEAFWLSLVGLVVLTSGIWMARGPTRRVDTERLPEEAAALMPSRLFLAYLAFGVVAGVALLLARFVPGLAQPLLAFGDLKAFFLYLLACTVLLRRQGQAWLASAVGIEVVVGLGGFFSGFKEVLYIVVIAYTTVWPFQRGRGMLGFAAVGALMLGLGIVWTAIKPDYRNFLNAGTSQQVVLRSPSERATYFIELVQELDAGKLAAAAGELAARTAQIDMFALVLEWVPRELPYTDGSLWEGAISHALVPRLLVPDKAVLPSDSELTMKYTGREMASGEQGTSISMGYMAESYIDFGRWGMFVPIFLVGLLWGLMFRYFTMLSGLSGLMRGGVAVSALLGAANFEIATVKLLGGTLMRFIVIALCARFLLPRIAPILMPLQRAERTS